MASLLWQLQDLNLIGLPVNADHGSAGVDYQVIQMGLHEPAIAVGWF